MRRGGLLLGEGLVEQPDDYGEVAPLVVGWEDDGVFFFIGDGRGGLAFWRHCVGSVESWIGEGVWLEPLSFNEWKENGYNSTCAFRGSCPEDRGSYSGTNHFGTWWSVRKP